MARTAARAARAMTRTSRAGSGGFALVDAIIACLIAMSLLAAALAFSGAAIRLDSRSGMAAGALISARSAGERSAYGAE